LRSTGYSRLGKLDLSVPVYKEELMQSPDEAIVQRVMDRAVSDPDFAARLRSDPVGVARAEGLSDAGLKAALNLNSDASHEEMTEELQRRVSHAGGDIWG
jgi:hypothetical protein